MRKHYAGFRNLIAWQEAKKLTLKIYELIKNFPYEEKDNLIDQLRRAAASVMANLAEGSAMTTKAHQNAYYNRAKASVVEIDNFIELSFDLKLVDRQTADELYDHCARLMYLIKKLIES